MITIMVILGIITLFLLILLYLFLIDRIDKIETQLNAFMRITNKELRDTEVGLQDLEETFLLDSKVQNVINKAMIELIEELQPKTKINDKKEGGKKSTTKKV